MLLDIHGLRIACDSSSPAIEDALVRPFRSFLAPPGGAPPLVRVHAEPAEPPYADLPPLAARFSTPRNVVYEHEGLKIVDYFGRGVALRDAARTGYRLWSRDPNLLQEIFYLLVLSLLGEHCDRVGRLRVHALAVSHRDRAFLFLMPSGSGKSTLALGLMETGRFGYISDDDPLFDPHLGILPFPRSLGTLDRERLAAVPDRFVARVDRMEFGTKYLLDSEWWGERVERRALDDIVLVAARRVLNGPPRVEPLSRRAMRKTLVREAVLGLGLYQGLEFMVQSSTTELATRLPVLVRRWLLARRLVARSRTFLLVANRDPAAVRREVERFVEELA